MNWVKEKDGQETVVKVDENTRMKYQGSSLNYPSLNILAATKDDQGHYSCQIQYPPNSAESADDNITWPKTFLHVH